jgi:protein phosphatase
MNISIGARTDVGGRSNNEDCLAVLDRERVPLRADAVLVIADGMGGRSNGEEASGIAVKIVRETLMELLDPTNEVPLPPAEDILAAAMRRANSMVYELSQENPDLPGMGTTCIAALVSEGILTLAHVGDSRAYLIRDNKIRPLTTDHTYVADQVKAGNMTLDAAKKSKFRNVITRAIGIAPTVEPDFETFALHDSDTVLLCTDGLSNTVEEDGILGITVNNDTAQGTANSLLEAAKAGGVRDNVTIIAVRVTSDVQSGRFKRAPNVQDWNGTSSSGAAEHDEPTAEDAHQTPAPAKQAPAKNEPPMSSLRIAGVAFFCAILGAVVTVAALMATGFINTNAGLTPSTPTDTGTGPAAVATLPNYFGLIYQDPVQLYYKPIRPNFLLLDSNGLFVALSQSGKVVHLNGEGIDDGKVPAGTMAPLSTPSPLSYATDPAGDIYLSDTLTGSVSQINPDGNLRRIIVKNLVKPTALAVAADGDVYVIDNGELFVARGTASAGKT